MNKIVTTIRFREELKNNIEKIAKEQNRSVSNLIETITAKWLKEKQEADKNV